MACELSGIKDEDLLRKMVRMHLIVSRTKLNFNEWIACVD